jgi:hypothetical protein
LNFVMHAIRTITNSPQDFQLLNLAPERGHPEQRGPFMFSQEGAAPGDPRARHCAFVLTRRGTWLHHFVVFRLSREARATLVEFPSAGEALAFAENLPRTPAVESLESILAWLCELGLANTAGRAGIEADRARLQAQHAT